MFFNYFKIYWILDFIRFGDSVDCVERSLLQTMTIRDKCKLYRICRSTNWISIVTHLSPAKIVNV